jgi:hypothetical protein
MSLGWQTESALLPSKAKPIQVDNKSMVGLKSILLQKEQERALRLSRDPDGHQRNSSRQLRGFSEKISQGNENFQSKKRSYTQMEDVPSDDGDSEPIRENKIRIALEAKAKIYEKLQNQAEDINSNDPISKVTLIDFQSQKQQKETLPSDYQSLSSQHAHSDVSVEDIRNELIKQKDKVGFGEGKVVLGAPQYHWSTGHTGTESTNSASTSDTHTGTTLSYGREKQVEKEIKRAIEEELTHRQGQAAMMSQAARVKSQWEKTLSNEAKELADRVHIETEISRSLARPQQSSQQQLTQQSLSSHLTNSRSAQTNNPKQTGGSEVHQERLELLRQKRERLLQQQQQRLGKQV